MSCNKCGNSSPTPCCQDCPESNPCENGCLDFIYTNCIESVSDEFNYLDIAKGTKLDLILRLIDSELESLNGNGDKFVKVTALDPSSGYLSDKITTCGYLTKQIITSGGQQKIELCINQENFLSENSGNPLFFDLDGLNINYTTLVQQIVSDPDLVQLFCNALNGCTPE